MGRYVEKNLYNGELIVEQAKLNRWPLFGKWVFGILFCWVLLIPLVIAIVETCKYVHKELAVTNKRVICKVGIFKRFMLEVPLDKIYQVEVKTTFWGNVFNVNKIRISTDDGYIPARPVLIHDVLQFKNAVLEQVEEYEESRLARHADRTI